MKFLKLSKILNTAKKAPVLVKSMPKFGKQVFYVVKSYLIFLVMFTLYVINIPTIFLIRSSKTPHIIRLVIMKFNVLITKAAAKYEVVYEVRMGWFDLFDLAFRNMSFKKTRSIITVGGMALGIGAIVFLVSLGYGIQNLVITRVARLEEMKQIDVSVQPGSRNKITDKSLEDFRNTDNVEDALPLVGVAAKVKFEGSITDVAVYGVTTKFLEKSAIKPTEGELFKSIDRVSLNKPHYLLEDNTVGAQNPTLVEIGDVAGTTAVKNESRAGDKIGDIEYTIFPNSWLKVRKSPSTNSEVIGYTKRVVGTQFGEEFWGSEYLPAAYGKVAQGITGEWMGKWVKSLVPLWEDKECSKKDLLCEEGSYYPVLDESGGQSYAVGYIAELEISIKKTVQDPEADSRNVLGIENVRLVLGDSSPGDSLTSTSQATGSSGPGPASSALEQLSDEEFISQVYESSASASLKQSVKMDLPDGAQKEAVVNNAFLKVLGFHETGAVGKTFNVSFVLTGSFLDSQEKVESNFTEYKIVGVIPGEESPFFYVPLGDLKYLGVINYSQAKVITDDAVSLPDVRRKIESAGYLTSSVVDTVAQINKLFSTIRLILGLLGGVALGVASLGMFNTLTVSLLERTREVGLMKAMGMATEEVKRLFLTESMLMGFMGGIIGIILGFLVGKLIAVVLSIMGLLKGAGFIDVTYIPPTFLVLIFILSLTVGLVTGIYPSKRATKISALDALRYE